MTEKELKDRVEAMELLLKIRDNYIPPGPFLGGYVWNMKKEDAIEALIKWKNKND